MDPDGETRTAFFFFNDTATTEIYTLSLHDALPISSRHALQASSACAVRSGALRSNGSAPQRSEEHTSELQSQSNLVCRLLLEKKKISIILHEFSHGIVSRVANIKIRSLWLICTIFP